MNMIKYEKEILENKNLDAPDESILLKAQSIMPQKKHFRLNSKQLFAIISSCAMVLIVIICIPFMMPAKNDMGFVKNMDLEITEIESIDSYNAIANQNILHFNFSKKTNKYSYKNQVVLLEEYASISDTKILLLVKMNKNTSNLLFEKEEEYTQFLVNTQQHYVLDKTILWSNFEGNIYITFTYGDFTYYIKMTGNISDWQNLLNEFLF